MISGWHFDTISSSDLDRFLYGSSRKKFWYGVSTSQYSFKCSGVRFRNIGSMLVSWDADAVWRSFSYPCRGERKWFCCETNRSRATSCLFFRSLPKDRITKNKNATTKDIRTNNSTRTDVHKTNTDSTRSTGWSEGWIEISKRSLHIWKY